MQNTTLRNVEDVYPLTAMQQGMLYHTVTDPSSGVFVNQIITPLTGDLDIPSLKKAWETLLARHSSLRTAFLWDGLDEPLQVVRAEAHLDWRELDLSTEEPDAQLFCHLSASPRAGPFSLNHLISQKNRQAIPHRVAPIYQGTTS